MGFWKGFRKVAAKAATITGKTGVAGTRLAAKGVAAGARTVYNNRKEIGAVAMGTTKVAAKTVAGVGKGAYKMAAWSTNKAIEHRKEIGAVAMGTTKVAAKTVAVVGKGAYKTTALSATKIVEHREKIGGTTVGALNGLGQSIADTTAHAYATKARLQALVTRIAQQSAEYRAHVKRLYGRLDGTESTGRDRDPIMDTIVVGGNTVAAYATFSVSVPADVERAYQLAYPDLAEHRSFLQEVRSLDPSRLPGLVAGIKGKLFEIQYVDYLNDGHLPDGYHASMAALPNQPGWDIAIVGPDGHLSDVIQAKATDSVGYVKDALEHYPHIDVVSTHEIHSHLIMQGFADHVIDSDISNASLHETVAGATDGAAMNFSWMPSVLSLALIAFSAYSQEGLDMYEKSKNFGERSMRSYLAYLAGGALAVATGFWWLGMLGGMGTRVFLGRGRAKRTNLRTLKRLAAENERILRTLRMQHA